MFTFTSVVLTAPSSATGQGPAASVRHCIHNGFVSQLRSPTLLEIPEFKGDC